MVNVLILRAPGTNCDVETSYAFQRAGADCVDVVHINRLLRFPRLLDDVQVLCVPGGFSFGDDIGAGRIFAVKLRDRLGDIFRTFCDAGKLILGICNGFQVLLKSGLILPEDSAGAAATLTWNNNATYTDKWVHLRVEESGCVFLRGVRELYLPVAHAEGRFVPRGGDVLSRLDSAGQLALKYVDGENPNGSVSGVAGVCDSTGRIFGLMPHPERFLDMFQHPHWTRLVAEGKFERDQNRCNGDGFAIFQNAISYFKK
ncbi:MAG: phosphoribosylformylglycinamidine synthase subunit PurQ [Planctomycetaceae bacterium]|jgi:phosphoribosylformylglycinamidine synthase|nr:phosphoribosylformylglycinamidine synthase subunit PurQ [Planctomycetaceae bacterium]